MIDTSLIIVEGLPATGKTTTSQFLQIQLERNGHTVEWVHEVADPHPTIFIPDGLALDERYQKIALEKWAVFTEKALGNPDEIHIVDSAVFQCNIFLFLLNNALGADLQNFVREIFNIIEPLKPCLFYLYREDADASIDFLEKDRGTRDLAKLWERDQALPYYRDKPEGAEGFKQFLRDYAAMAQGLFDAAACKKAALEINHDDWTHCKNEMLSFLGIEGMPDPDGRPVDGVYRNEALQLEMAVDGFTMVDPVGNTRGLIPKSGNEFYVERLPVVLRFEDPGRVAIAGSPICEEWTATGTIFEKI